MALPTMDLAPILDNPNVLQLETTLILYGVMAGAVGWDLAYYIPHDIKLLASRGWASPVRAVSRTAYLVARYLAFAALVISLRFWGYPSSSDDFCRKIPILIEALLCASYVSTITVLAFRTLALYPGHRRVDWVVTIAIVLGWLLCFSWAFAVPFYVSGQRMAAVSSRCQLHQKSDDTVLRGFMASLLAFDAIILLLTLYKVYRSGSYRFFNSNTVLGTILGKKNRNLHDEDPMKLAATKVAADLIGQGLYDFIILFLVGVAALVIWCTTSLPRIYRSLGVIGLAAVSAALAGGVFRETARAATALHAFRDFELKLQAMQQLAETQHKELEALFYARRYRDDDEDYDAQSKFTADHSNNYHREATTPVPLSAHESDRITVSRQPSYTGEFRTPTEKGWTGPHTDDGYTSEPLSRNMVHGAQPLSPTAPRPQEEASPIEELEYSRRDSTDLHSAAHLNARTADQDDSDSEATFGKGLETRSDSDFRRYMRQNAPPSTHQTRSLRRAKRGRTVYGADERFPDFATSLARSTAIAVATNSRTQQLGFSAAADGSRSGSASGSAYNAGASASSSRNNLPLGMSLAAFDAPSEEGSEGTHTSFPLPPERRDTLAGVTILGGGVETNWSRPTTLYSAPSSLPTAHGGGAGLPHPPPTYSSRTALNTPGNEAYEMGSRDAAGLSSSLPPPRRPSRKPVGNREYGA